MMMKPRAKLSQKHLPKLPPFPEEKPYYNLMKDGQEDVVDQSLQLKLEKRDLKFIKLQSDWKMSKVASLLVILTGSESMLCCCCSSYRTKVHLENVWTSKQMITEGDASISLRRLGAPSVIKRNQNKDQLQCNRNCNNNITLILSLSKSRTRRPPCFQGKLNQ